MTQKDKNTMAREMVDAFMCDQSRNPIIIIDPEGDYAPLVKQLGGSITEVTRRESYHAAKPDTAKRRQIILDILTERGELTAQEIAAELHRRGITPFDERNFAAPRLTELKAAGQIEVTGKKMCDRSGRNVALWAVKKGV